MALWIIGGILLLLILLLLLRVGVHLRFGEQLELTVIAGPARIRLLPRRLRNRMDCSPRSRLASSSRRRGALMVEAFPCRSSSFRSATITWGRAWSL